MSRQTSSSLVLTVIILFLMGCSSADPASTRTLPTRPAASQVPQATLTPEPPKAEELKLVLLFRNSQGAEIDHIVDGNVFRIQAQLNTKATSPINIKFSSEERPGSLGECAVEAGADACEITLRADGWAWEARKLVEARNITVTASGGAQAIGRKALAVAPKPVVLVHGLNSDFTTWTAWTEPGGFLAQVGLLGYAVGDGQFGFSQKMNTGSFSTPKASTKSIAENAQIWRSTLKRCAAALALSV